MMTKSRQYLLFVVMSLCIFTGGWSTDGFSTVRAAASPMKAALGRAVNADNDITCLCWIDGTLFCRDMLPPAGGKLSWQIDVSDLADGMHDVYIQALDTNGVVSRTNHTLFYKVPAPPENGEITCLCWIDGTLICQDPLPAVGGSLHWQFDVSNLADGMHDVYIQAVDNNGAVSRTNHTLFYKVPAPPENGEITCLCWIDGIFFAKKSLPPTGGSLSWQLDVSELTDGMHDVYIQAVDNNGAVSRTNHTLFFKTTPQPTTAIMRLDYDIDGIQSGVLSTDVHNGLYHFDIDVDKLTDGMHCLTCFLRDDNGYVATIQRHFLKIPQDGYGVKRYEYWLNQKDSVNIPVNVELDELADPFILVDSLMFEHWPIRSSYFHFAVEQGNPVVYALNDLHVCFYDKEDRCLALSRPFVDIAVKENVTDITLLEPGDTKTAPRPGENEILWYKVVAQRGDGLYFKADRACTIQIFSPTGEELSALSGTESTVWGGIHAPASGTFYIAQHDMTATNGTTLSISYQHADPVVEDDWEVLKRFYNKYHNQHFTWDMSDRYNAIDFEGLTVEMGRVTSLSLPGKSLQGTFPTMLLELSQLRDLNLGNNKLSGDVASDISSYISEKNIKPTAMHQLNLSGNKFTGNVGALAALFANLTALDVSANRFDQIEPMVKSAVTLNLSNQALQGIGDLTVDYATFISSLPAICRYNHPEQKFSNNINVQLSNDGQSPHWIWTLSANNGQYTTGGSSAYYGDNGQAVAGATRLPGTWPNQQNNVQLQFLFNRGDANLNGIIDITDLQAMVNFIFSEYNKPFNFTAANLNNDEILNVQDVVGETGLLQEQMPGMNIPANHRAPAEDIAAQAALDWIDGVLYLNSTVPVASMDIVNKADNIEWLLSDLSMIVSTTSGEQGLHSVVYSLGDAVIPPGKTAIAKTATREPSIVAATLSDPEAELIPVRINTGAAGLKPVTADGFNCHWDGTSLVFTSGMDMNNVDIVVYAIDGRMVLDKHLNLLPIGTTAIDVREVLDMYQPYIVVVRQQRQLIATQKLTPIR